MVEASRRLALPLLLLFHPFDELYGSDRMVVTIVRALQGRYRCTVVLPSGSALADLVIGAGADVHFLEMPPIRRSLLRPGALLRFVVRTPRVILRTLLLLRAMQPDVCYVNTIVNPIVLLACRLAGRPTVCHVHEAEQDASAALQYALTAPLALAHRVVANSADTAAFVGRRLRFLSTRTTVVYNAVAEPARPRPLPEGAPPQVRLVLLGRWSERKGADVAIEAVRLVRQHGLDATLDVVGGVFPGYEWYERHIRELATAPGLVGAVRFRPFVADPSGLYENAHIVLVPSRVEAFGLVAVEGLLRERVVLAADVGGLVEVMDGLPEHWTFEAGSPSALAASIATCTADWPSARAGARCGRELAARRFGEARFATELVAEVEDARRAGRRSRRDI